MAKMVASEIADGKISVKYEITDDASKFGYADTLHMKLDTSKIKVLGWSAKTNLNEAFKKMICYMKSQKSVRV